MAREQTAIENGSASRAEPTPGQLRAFVALAQELHFGRAARRLDLAVSSLSETLARLEATLDRTLFERTSRYVALTKHGEALLPRAVDILRRLEALQMIDVESNPVEATTLRIGLGGAGFGDLTRPILEEFCARHPQVRLRLREVGGSSPQSISDASYDLVMTHLPLAHEQLIVQPIATEPRVLLMPASHPAAERELLDLREFRHDLFIAFAPGASEIRDYWLAVPERGGERPRIGAVAYSVADVVNQVRCLGLVAIGPQSLASVVSGPGIVVGRLHELEPCVMALVTRAGDDNPLLADFLAVSRHAAQRVGRRVSGIAAMG